MPIFTAIAASVAAIAGAIGFTAATAATIGAIGAFAARTLLTIGISKLLSNRSTDAGAQGASNAGARIQLAPATNNKLPVVYGDGYVGPVITDAVISTDQNTMWYVCAISEVTDSGSISFGNIYYNGQLVAFDGTDPAKVASLTNNANPPQVDTTIAGNLFIYLFNDGSASGINTSGQTAIQILQDSSIPVYSRWTENDLMSKTSFMIVKIIYNQNAQTTTLGQFSVQVKNTLNKPGSVMLDYLTNIRYGCSLPLTQIDTASLISLDTYSDELITFIPVGGGTATQARYRINGPLNTGQNCLANLQDLADACDSWIQYSELTGKWKVVINQSYEQAGHIIDDLYLINSYNLIGGIDISPIDLNSTYNSLEIQYPNVNIKDQTDYQVFNLIDYVPVIMSPNEPANQLVVSYPQVNNYIQAAYLGERRLLQSREDLIITCALDYSGIQIEAGDVVRVTLAEYGWNEKLFRVSQVQETKDGSGFLGARITAFEYNDTIYADNPLDDFIPEANTGLTNPKLLSQPGTPILATNPLTNGTVASFEVTSSAPAVGTTIYMDFNYGTTTDTNTHKLYSTTQTSDGTPFTLGDTVSINVADLPPATYYWSVTARTDVSGIKSNCSASYVWTGPNVTQYNHSVGAGGLTFDQLGPGTGASKTIASISYEVGNRVTGVATLPINTNTYGTLIKTLNFNVPQYIQGTTPTGGYIYPYREGTSSTSTGYLANSTGPYTPPDASALEIYNGDSSWYVLVYKTFSPVASYYTIQQNLDCQFASSYNSTIQIVPFLTFTTSTQLIVADTQQMTTLNIISGTNFWNTGRYGTLGATTVDGAGFLYRNITAATQVDVVGMSWRASITLP